MASSRHLFDKMQKLNFGNYFWGLKETPKLIAQHWNFVEKKQKHGLFCYYDYYFYWFLHSFVKKSFHNLVYTKKRKDRVLVIVKN